MTLERDLRALAAGFPDPPALVPGVSAGIARASRRRRRRRVAVLALALFLLVPATVLAVSPDLRHRVLETFGLRNAKVEVVEQLPAVPPAAPGVSSLQLGSLTTLQQARNDLRLRIDPPAALGRPDAIYSDQLKTGAEVSFLYEPRHRRRADRRAQARPRERAARRVQPGFPGQDGDEGDQGHAPEDRERRRTADLRGALALGLLPARAGRSTRRTGALPARHSCGSGAPC